MIRFDAVTKNYPGQTRPALDSISVEILRGEFVFLVGASGSGKSSFLRLILKEETPTGGHIHVLGQDLGSISARKVPYFRRNLGVVFQDFRLLPNKSVQENVAFTLRVIGKSRGYITATVGDALKLVGLDGKGKRMPHELSGGEQQRVAIARALVNKPQILLADEPTGNLDPITSAGIMSLLEQINARGTTVVMATHEAGIVNQMQRRVIELSQGHIMRDQHDAGYDGHTIRDPLLESHGTTVMAPKVTPEIMQEAQPLYVEPEEVQNAVTDAAALITAAATGQVLLSPPEPPEPLAPTGPAVTAHGHTLNPALVERLGVRANEVNQYPPVPDPASPQPPVAYAASQPLVVTPAQPTASPLLSPSAQPPVIPVRQVPPASQVPVFPAQPAPPAAQPPTLPTQHPSAPLPNQPLTQVPPELQEQLAEHQNLGQVGAEQ